MAHKARFLSRAVALAVPLTVLVACDSSQRFGGYGSSGSLARAEPAAPPPPLTAAPSLDDADTQTLPPPPGSGAIAGTAPLPPPAPGGLTSGLPPAPGTSPAPGGVATAPGNLPRVATAPVPSAPAAAPTRTGVTGNWSLTESAGNRCRITLSSAPKLDLYGAGTNGCKATELQRVNAWELSGSEVILYESGGAVVARLRQSGDGAFSGVSTRSGAPISMAK